MTTKNQFFQTLARGVDNVQPLLYLVALWYFVFATYDKKRAYFETKLEQYTPFLPISFKF